MWEMRYRVLTGMNVVTSNMSLHFSAEHTYIHFEQKERGSVRL